MPNRATDPAPHRTPMALAALAAVACVACCLLPALITAGVLGAGASALVGWLPAVALALAVLAVGTLWRGRRRSPRGCAGAHCGQGGCGCQASPELPKITIRTPR